MKWKFLIFIVLFLLISFKLSLSEWKVFSEKETGASWVRGIKSDSHNNIWIIGDHFHVFNGEKILRKNYFEKQSYCGRYLGLIIDKKDNIWLTNIYSTSIRKYDGKDVINYRLTKLGADQCITTLACDSNNNIWIATTAVGNDNLRSFGIVKFDGEKFTYYSFFDDSLKYYRWYSIAVDKNNNIWAVGSRYKVNKTVGSVLVKYDGKSWKNIPKEESGYRVSYPWRVAIDNYGNLWVGGGNQLQKFDGTNWSDPNEPMKDFDFYNQTCFCPQGMVFDRNNNLYAASYRGLLKWDGKKWTYFHKTDMGTSSCELYSVHIDKKNRIWVGNLVGDVAYNDDLVSVEEQRQNQEDFEIFPNPANDKIKLKVNNITGSIEFVVYNIYGNIVKQMTVSSEDNRKSEFEINVNDLSSGMYFVTFNTEYGLFTKKVIVRH